MAKKDGDSTENQIETKDLEHLRAEIAELLAKDGRFKRDAAQIDGMISKIIKKLGEKKDVQD